MKKKLANLTYHILDRYDSVSCCFSTFCVEKYPTEFPNEIDSRKQGNFQFFCAKANLKYRDVNDLLVLHCFATLQCSNKV